MSRIIAHLVTKNEADRYLTHCLSDLTKIVDEIFVVDDQSTDNTVVISESLGADVRVRPNSVSPFSVDEGLFREWAWNSLPADEGDLILCIDADEFLIHEGPPRSLDPLKVREELLDLETSLRVSEKGRMKVYEIFDEPGMQYRVDGYWDGITADRFLRYSKGTFKPGPSTGSLPRMSGGVRHISRISIAHLGYAVEADRVAKYERYRGKRGHNPKHVDSILREPTLRPLYAQ